MSKNILDASILLLRSRALESYGIIKDALNAPAEEGIADKIAAQALRLAQFEGGMITLQQYHDGLLQPSDPQPEPEPPEAEPPRNVVRPEQSAALRRSLKQQAKKKGSDTNDE
jgi:hypothetical protein